MTIEESLKHLQAAQLMLMGEDNQPISDLYYAMDTAIKSLETIQRIDDILNTEGMTEVDALDEIMEALSEFKYDCGVSE